MSSGRLWPGVSGQGLDTDPRQSCVTVPWCSMCVHGRTCRNTTRAENSTPCVLEQGATSEASVTTPAAVSSKAA